MLIGRCRTKLTFADGWDDSGSLRPSSTGICDLDALALVGNAFGELGSECGKWCESIEVSVLWSCDRANKRLTSTSGP